MTPLLLRSMLLVFFGAIVGSFGAVFLKLGALRLNRSILSFVNSRVILGVVLYLGSSVFYLMGLRGGQLSVLYPIVSLGYVWTLLWSKLFFNEALTRYKFAGLGLILAGVFLVGMGSAAGVTGKWSGTIAVLDQLGNPGDPSPFSLVLKQEGATVTGAAGPDASQQWPIQKGRVEGDRLTLETTSPDGVFHLVVATVENERISGAVTLTERGESRKAKIDLKRIP